MYTISHRVAGYLEREGILGSCLTNIGHFRANAKLREASGEPIPPRLWLAPPTKMGEYVASAQPSQEIAVKLIA